MAMDPFFDELSDGVCVSDDEGNLLYMNRAAERLLGTSIAKARGKTLCELLCGHLADGGSPECASCCELRDPSSGVNAVTFRGRYGPLEAFDWVDFRVQRRSVFQNLRVRCLKTPPSFLGEGRHLALIEDATAEVEFERQKEDWRHMIAHDLGSPLTNIYNTLRLLQASEGRPAEDCDRELVDISVRSCQKVIELLTLYLDVAKLDAGVTQTKLEPVNLAGVVGRSVEEQSALAQARRIELKSDVPAVLAVQADAELLARVVQNVLNNAVKYTPEGGRVEVSARPEKTGALLTVKDTGPGIAAEDMPFIFDRYYQAKARRAGKLHGTGLGLTFCREALKAMGGEISVDSEPGKGAEFRISLPAAQTAPPLRTA